MFALAIGLGADCFAVSLATNASKSPHPQSRLILLAASFGVFQASMPILGWFAGLALASTLLEFNRYIASSLLFAIGVKMLYDSRKDEKIEKTLSLATVLLLSVATSIDAMAAGVSFAFLDVSLVVSITLIGAVSFFMSLAGSYVGRSFGAHIEGGVEAAGAAILIALAIKVLLFGGL